MNVYKILTDWYWRNYIAARHCEFGSLLNYKNAVCQQSRLYFSTYEKWTSKTIMCRSINAIWREERGRFLIWIFYSIFVNKLRWINCGNHEIYLVYCAEIF